VVAGARVVAGAVVAGAAVVAGDWLPVLAVGVLPQPASRATAAAPRSSPRNMMVLFRIVLAPFLARAARGAVEQKDTCYAGKLTGIDPDRTPIVLVVAHPAPLAIGIAHPKFPFLPNPARVPSFRRRGVGPSLRTLCSRYAVSFCELVRDRCGGGSGGLVGLRCGYRHR
jgi:hypothetical protein